MSANASTLLNATTPAAANTSMLHADTGVDAIVSNFGTGVAVLDALLCMLLSVVLQQVLAALQSQDETALFSRLYRWVFGRSADPSVSRVIEITQRFDPYGNKIWDYEQKNHLLQKAISIYLADMIDLRNKDATYDLLEKPKKKKNVVAAAAAKQLEDDNDDCDTSVSSFSDNGSAALEEEEDNAYYGTVNNLSVETMPPLNTWVQIEKGINFMQQRTAPASSGDAKGPSSAVVRFMFQSTLPDASERIDELIKRAYKQYQESERKKYVEDKARYFYIQAGTKGTTSESDSASTVAYKRYALGEDKTFENLFFEEKETVLQLLDNFTNKSGKFAIKGFPYKLGLLLHGPPGTGKTSLIKAVAQHTKRHIVTISLGKIRTNQELLDALFDMKFAVQGLDTPVEMDFEDVVFVMEDIDCASSIVNAREEKLTVSAKNQRMLDSQKKAVEKDDDGGVSTLLDGAIGPMMKPKSNDKLNLSGLLNVLDGVIDCPGRIVIMTTNHPEKLDPALIRPGRVNKKLLLSYMGASHIQEMVEYYSTSKFTEEQCARLAAIMADTTKKFTPAEVEEACAEFDDIDSILNGLAACH